jgi:very-short-patch-repair endonuclease
VSIEIDGKSHEYQKDYDELRTHVINNLGVSVERFKNEEVERELNEVMERLKEIMCRRSLRTHPVVPLLGREGDNPLQSAEF